MITIGAHVRRLKWRRARPAGVILPFRTAVGRWRDSDMTKGVRIHDPRRAQNVDGAPVLAVLAGTELDSSVQSLATALADAVGAPSAWSTRWPCRQRFPLSPTATFWPLRERMGCC